jgi:hypothetical protein
MARVEEIQARSIDKYLILKEKAASYNSDIDYQFL